MHDVENMVGDAVMISFYVLMSAGFVLLLLDLAMMTYVLTWFGLSAFLVGFAALFGWPSEGWGLVEPWGVQLIVLSIFGVVMTIAFKKPMQRWLAASAQADVPDNEWKPGECARIVIYERNPLVEWGGTWWRIANQTEIEIAHGPLEAGQLVHIDRFEKNAVVVSRCEHEPNAIER